MKIIENQKFDQERALYACTELLVQNCSFDGPADGESAFKECHEVEVNNCFFNLRYPFWHDCGLKIVESEMTSLCRASLWYSEHIEIQNTKLHGIKALRECSDVVIEGCDIISPEFGWSVDGIQMMNTTAESEYFMMRSAHLRLENVKFKGKYSFQYIKDAELEYCELDTKDAFWHCENVTVKNSIIKGEYLAWYSDGLTLINCKIIGTQPLCYCKNLTLIDCEMADTDLCFERSEVQAVVISSVDSIKNPLCGWIKAPEIREIIMDMPEAKGKIITESSFSKEKQKMMVAENQEFVKAYLSEELPQLKATDYYNTCFMRLDFVKMLGSAWECVNFIQEKTGLYISYGKDANKEFLRINIACKQSELKEFLALLKKWISMYEKNCVERC